MNLGIITEDDVRRLTAIELMLLIIERSNGLLEYLRTHVDESDKRFDALDKKYQQITDEIKSKIIENETYFNEIINKNLESIALTQMNNWLSDGTLESLINETALKNISDRVSVLENKTQPIITPEQFGAVGDGVTDDTEAIQRASDSCKSGQTLQFKANTKYKISDTITFYRTNVIDGNGCFIMMDDNFRGETRFAFRYHHTANNNII